MTLFKISETGLSVINEKSFELEKHIQKLSEDNLKTIFGLELVQSEFELQRLRIDTLAFSPETKSFIIIEYKNDRNFSVIDQGFAYLSLLLNNKAEFILEYNGKFGKTLQKEDIVWDQTRVYFVAPAFTEYQKKAIEFKDLPILLFTVKKYENNLISIDPVLVPEKSESINKVTKSDVIQKVTKEIRVYSEEDHQSGASEAVKELYEHLKNEIFKLGQDVVMEPQKFYISFKRKSNFVDVCFQKNRLKFWINLRKGQLVDSFNLCRDVSEIGHLGNGDYEIMLDSSKEIINVMQLIKQSYDKN
ncbi:hypothetical protein KKF81_03570 [Candidatus Micrarchaeota archaeon]|nr:hypothetical protein [Candidatus Micrarchaeota archaeon]